MLNRSKTLARLFARCLYFAPLCNLLAPMASARVMIPRQLTSEPPAFVLLQRSRLRPPGGQSGDVLVAADLKGDALARRTAEALSNPATYPHEALRLYQFVRNHLARDAGLPAAERAALSEPAYLFLSDRQGGFPAQGFWLEQPDGSVREMRGVPFVDIQFDMGALSGRSFGDFEQIFAHELGHVMMQLLAGQPDHKASTAIHYVTVRTDPWYAFSEGWGEHFQPAAMDHLPSVFTQSGRAQPLPSATTGWYARFAHEQTRGCYFCPANRRANRRTRAGKRSTSRR
jgi:hypothetical protein